MQLLTQFIFRLSFGLAAAMAVTPRYVTSGYYRNNLYVLLGLNVLATVAGFTSNDGLLPRWLPLAAVMLSYAGAAAWLYNKGPLGIAILSALAAVSLWAAESSVQLAPLEPSAATRDMALACLRWLDPIAGGLVLGTVMAAMLLGHWYLNAPGMRIEPLERLVDFVSLAATARGLLGAVSLWLLASHASALTPTLLAMLALRWLAGIVGVLILAWMASQTLKIPNTQSATGILYVAVIGTFIGELAAQLLAAETGIPV